MKEIIIFKYINMNELDFNDGTASQRANVMNSRAYSRNIPSQPLQPYLDARSVSTKYATLPVIDLRKKINVPLKQEATYHPSQTFNPGNDFGPWSGFSSNINHESELRGQIYALQNCDQATYVPSSQSSMYKFNWQNNKQIAQPFPDLFKTETFNMFNPNPDPEHIGFALFNNATRQHIKDLTKPTTCSPDTNQLKQPNQQQQPNQPNQPKQGQIQGQQQNLPAQNQNQGPNQPQTPKQQKQPMQNPKSILEHQGQCQTR